MEPESIQIIEFKENHIETIYYNYPTCPRNKWKDLKGCLEAQLEILKRKSVGESWSRTGVPADGRGTLERNDGRDFNGAKFDENWNLCSHESHKLQVKRKKPAPAHP